MIKVHWFLKRADNLSIEEFHDWWLNIHAPAICKDQAPFLAKYVIDTTVQDLSGLPGNPKGKDLDWDGIGTQYFRTEADYQAVYSRKDRPTTADTMSKIKAIRRLVVVETEFDVRTGDRTASVV